MHKRLTHWNHENAGSPSGTSRQRVRSLLIMGMVLIALAIGVGIPLRNLLTDDLLRRATRIADQRDWSSHDYFWLPPASRVRLVAPPQGDWYLAEKAEQDLLEAPLLTFPDSLFRASAMNLYFVDSSGPPPQDLFEEQNVYLFGLSLSPDGRWLLCPVLIHGQTRILLEEIRTQKQHFCTDSYAADSLSSLAQTWTPDSSTCITTSLGRDCALLRIRTLQAPDRVRSVHVHGSLGDKLLGITVDGRLLSSAVGVFRDEPVLLLSTELTTSTTSVRHIAPYFPPGQRGTEVVLSPQGDRLLWIAKAAPAIDGSKIPFWARRFLGSRILPSSTFWVTRADGSGLIRVGSIALSEHEDWDAWPLDPHWLPDGAHVSFTYHKTLWTVPIEAAPH